MSGKIPLKFVRIDSGCVHSFPYIFKFVTNGMAKFSFDLFIVLWSTVILHKQVEF